MSKQNFNELGNIQAALSTLRQYNQYVLFPVSETVFDNPVLLEYFSTPLDAPIEKTVEKIVSVAAAKAVYENPHIPVFNKERSARNTARDVREAMRYAKLEYHAQAKGLSHKEYMRRKRDIAIIKRATKIKIAKGLAKNVTITAFSTLIAGPVGGSVALGSRLIWKFLPEKVKKPIANAAKVVKEKAIATIKNCCNYIKSTKIGKKITKIIEKTSPVFQEAGKKIAYVGRAVVDCAKSFWPF
jgi:hypothetical protein